VQRYFSTFPGGWPGVGLLLLRIVVGAGATAQGAVYLTHMTETHALMWIAGVVAIVSGLALLPGFLTPASGAAAGVATLFIVITGTPSDTSVLIGRLAAAILVVDAVVLVLLGPGALSIDARLFGRREIVVPHDQRL
jgi:uncharacterized membrane protein YphA (DoxX/SURF4 family)